MVSSFLQFCLEPLCGGLSRPVVIQAEHHVPQVLILLQHPVHGLSSGAAQGHIAVGLPVIRVQGQKRQHVDGRLKHIEQIVSPHMVEAVLGAAALHIDLKGLAPAVGAPFVGVAGDATLVRAHKDAVVVLGVLIEQPLPGKVGDDGAVDLPLLMR